MWNTFPYINAVNFQIHWATSKYHPKHPKIYMKVSLYQRNNIKSCATLNSKKISVWTSVKLTNTSSVSLSFNTIWCTLGCSFLHILQESPTSLACPTSMPLYLLQQQFHSQALIFWIPKASNTMTDKQQRTENRTLMNPNSHLHLCCCFHIYLLHLQHTIQCWQSTIQCQCILSKTTLEENLESV